MKNDCMRNKLIVIQHERKAKIPWFDQVLNGTKTFELRERRPQEEDNPQQGDFVRLREFDGQEYTGRVVVVRITYILRDVQEFGLRDGFEIWGIEKVPTP